MWCFLFCRHILYHISKGFSIKIVDICSFTDGLLKNLHGFRNIGYFNRPVGDNNPSVDSFHFQNQYTPIPGHYDDCVMREAVKNVRPGPYKLISRNGRVGGQYNCQDYADDLRAEYYRLLLDLKIRCKCNLK